MPELDACSESFDIPEKNTEDGDVDAVLLFADIDFTNPDAVANRAAEWRELFGGTP